MKDDLMEDDFRWKTTNEGEKTTQKNKYEPPTSTRPAPRPLVEDDLR